MDLYKADIIHRALGLSFIVSVSLSNSWMKRPGMRIHVISYFN